MLRVVSVMLKWVCRAGLRAAALCVPLVALLAAPAARAADPSVSIEYSGTLIEKYVADVSKPSEYTKELTLKWTETATDDAVTSEPLAAPAFSISGSIDLTSGHIHPQSCSGELSTRAGPYGNAPAGFIGGGLVSISAVLPASGKYVASDGSEECSLAPNEGLGVGGPGVTDPELTAASAPTETFPESETVFTHPYTVKNAVHRELAPNGLFESENTLSLSATLKATTTVHTGKQQIGGSGGGKGKDKGKAPASKGPPPSVGRRIRERKDQSRRDLPEAIREAWAAHGLAALTALPTAPLLSIADELGQAAGPIAANDATTRVLDDFRIYDDPPSPNVGVLANPSPVPAPLLPACKQTVPSEATYCSNLSAAYVALLTADGNAAADASALEQTVARSSAAARSRNTRALALQEGHAVSMARALAGAQSAKRVAASRVRSLLILAQPRWTLSLSESRSAIRWETALLARHGLRGRTLSRLAGAAITPRATNPLARL
jgi:hypothetical protein